MCKFVPCVWNTLRKILIHTASCVRVAEPVWYDHFAPLHIYVIVKGYLLPSPAVLTDWRDYSDCLECILDTKNILILFTIHVFSMLWSILDTINIVFLFIVHVLFRSAYWALELYYFIQYSYVWSVLLDTANIVILFWIYVFSMFRNVYWILQTSLLYSEFMFFQRFGVYTDRSILFFRAFAF